MLHHNAPKQYVQHLPWYAYSMYTRCVAHWPFASYLVTCRLCDNAHIRPPAGTTAPSGQCEGRLLLCICLMGKMRTFPNCENVLILAQGMRFWQCSTIILSYTNHRHHHSNNPAVNAPLATPHLVSQFLTPPQRHLLLYRLRGGISCVSHTTTTVLLPPFSLSFSKFNVHGTHARDTRHLHPHPW